MTDRAKRKRSFRSPIFHTSYFALLLAVMLSASCAAPRSVMLVNPDITCVTQSSIDDDSLNADQKVIVATFSFNGDQAQAEEVLVTFGKTRTPISQGCNISFILVGSGDEALARYGIWDPRVTVVDEGPNKGLVAVVEASYTARFPFSPKAKEIRVLNNEGKSISTTDLSSPIRAFCGEYKLDLDCQSLNKVSP